MSDDDGNPTEHDDGGDKPDWWAENERLREEMDLPPYEPSRFRDGTYAHEVVRSIEKRHGSAVRFIGVETRYGDDWEVRIDGEPAFPVGRHRDDRGNTVYETTAEAFRERVREHLGPE